MVSIFSPEVAGTNSLLMKRPCLRCVSCLWIYWGVWTWLSWEFTGRLGVFGAVWGCELEGFGHNVQSLS
jgi:hypothetical protein